MIDIGFDFVRDGDELSRGELRRIAEQLKEQLYELEGIRDELLFELEVLDEKIADIKEQLEG